MWVKIKKSYSGPLGIFMKDGRYDLPESKVEQLRKTKGYRFAIKTTCAPWDDGKDVKAVAEATVRADIDGLFDLAKLRAKEQGVLSQKANELVAPLAEKQKVRDKASTAAEAAAEKAKNKNASPQAIAKAWDCARAHEEADAQFNLIFADMNKFMALATLARLESEDAERKAKRLAKENGIKLPGDEPEKPTKPAESAEQKEDAAQSEEQPVSAAESTE